VTSPLREPENRPENAGEARHLPVLPGPVVEHLDLRPGLIVVDGTVGAGGHARQIVELIHPGGRLIGLDRDPMMLAHAELVLDRPGVSLVHASYADLGQVLGDLGLIAADRVLVDLGLSSDQLADEARGFSFDADGPLDMRFDRAMGRPAADLVNRLPERELARIIYEYGEERHSRRIARRIVADRPLHTARELADVVRRAVPPVKGRWRIHPATRVFQALRIAVNDELDALRTLLDQELPQHLRPGGRAVMISFHSLEDRLIKQAFRDRSRWENLTRKPVTADDVEQAHNPRSRSAKLRAAVLKAPETEAFRDCAADRPAANTGRRT
jgi:16S rRNA (cytosine1402-N4)-methyltransferase